jgi:hypothetical protein
MRSVQQQKIRSAWKSNRPTRSHHAATAEESPRPWLLPSVSLSLDQLQRAARSVSSPIFLQRQFRYRSGGRPVPMPYPLGFARSHSIRLSLWCC